MADDISKKAGRKWRRLVAGDDVTGKQPADEEPPAPTERRMRGMKITPLPDFEYKIPMPLPEKKKMKRQAPPLPKGTFKV